MPYDLTRDRTLTDEMLNLVSCLVTLGLYDREYELAKAAELEDREPGD